MKSKMFMPIVFLTLLVACTSELTPNVDELQDTQPTAAILTPLSTPADVSPTPTISPIQTVENTRLKTQCLEVAARPPDDLTSSGIVILNRVNAGDPQKGNTLLLDMKTGNTTRIDRDRENQLNHVVSPNKNLMAYESVILESVGNIVKDELVIADAAGNRLKVIPWEKEWLLMLAWLDNEHLIIALLPASEEMFGKEPLTVLVLNPFSSERRILKPDFPGLLDAPLPTATSWRGWYGMLYDPTVTLAIYPHRSQNDDMYTYVIWDLQQQNFVASLGEIFTAFSYDPYPMPHWSPDGSRFVFRGVTRTPDTVRFELYRVKRDGEAEQLTRLNPMYLIQDTNLSWSPNSKYIAMFLNSWGGYGEKEAHVAVLDTETLGVIDYCISVTYSGKEYGGRVPSPAVWSPDSRQFLVVDWYEKDHQRLILVDIEKKRAVEIPENMEPVGWMTMATP